MSYERWTKCVKCGHRSAVHGMSGICMLDGCPCDGFEVPDDSD